VWPPGDVEQTVHALAQQGVLVRSMAGQPVISGRFRLTVAPPAHMQQLFASIAGNQNAMDRFVQMNAGTISPAEFFSASSSSAH